jgi:hypothetical protein
MSIYDRPGVTDVQRRVWRRIGIRPNPLMQDNNPEKLAQARVALKAWEESQQKHIVSGKPQVLLNH